MEPTSVQWLSLDEAIQAILTCWPALVGCLGQGAAAENPVAVGLSKKVESFVSIALSALLLKIMQVFSILSKAFQADTLNFPKNDDNAGSTLLSNVQNMATLYNFQTIMGLPVDDNVTVELKGVTFNENSQWTPWTNEGPLLEWATHQPWQAVSPR